MARRRKSRPDDRHARPRRDSSRHVVISSPMHILLVRHGETAWNREGRYQGRTDVPLSPDGEAQVRRLGARLAHVRIARAIASPLSRAKSTAEAILAGRDPITPLELDDGL